MKTLIEKDGIGIDIVNVERFRKKIFKQNIKFYQRIFLESEIKYCLKFKSPYEHFAGKFALKESVINQYMIKYRSWISKLQILNMVQLLD